jgi:MoxR-like ATPase
VSPAAPGGRTGHYSRVIDHPDLDAHAGRRFWDNLRSSVGRAVVGNEGPLRMLAVALLAEGHALLDDVPGVGKTLLARAFASSLGLTFARVQGTPDLLPADVTGSSVYDAGNASFRFIPGPVFTNLLLVDEINRATPRTQAALLEAMQERQVSAEGESRPLPEPFLVVATENPVELEGTFSLPEAELDRFLVRVSLGYPERDAELAIAARYTDRAEPLDDISPVTDAATILRLRNETRRITVSDDVRGYLVDLVRATREHADLRLGASPRASVALHRATQAWAYLDGRTFAVPEDVSAVAPAVLGHRLLLDLDRRLRGGTSESVLEDIIGQVAIPMPEPASAQA